MKVVAVNGSPHRDGNTFLALKKVTDTLGTLGIDSEIINIGDREIRGCLGCGGCKDRDCVLSDSDFTNWTTKMYESDGIIIGSPVYYAGIAGTLKSFLDRAFFQSKRKMRHKVGAGIAVCRRTGGMTTFDQINAYFLISEMAVAPSFYWNVGHGFSKGDVEKDLEGISTLTQLAHNMAWLLKMREEAQIAPPDMVKREMMNFIR